MFIFRNAYLLLILVLCLCQPFLDQLSTSKADRSVFSEDEFVLGEAVKGEHDNYYVLKDAFAEHEEAVNKNTDQSATKSKNDVYLTKKGGYSFYKKENWQTAKDAGHTSELPENSRVVLNRRTGSLGVVTGSILIKLKDFQDADAIVREYELTETHRFAGLMRLVVVKVPLNQLNAVLARVQADVRIERADPEILENFAQTQ